MNTLIKEEQYIMRVGTDTYSVRVQEFVWGSEPWPEKFRALVCAPNEWNATPVYGSTSREAAEAAAEYILSLEVAHTSRVEYPALGRLGPN